MLTDEEKEALAWMATKARQGLDVILWGAVLLFAM